MFTLRKLKHRPWPVTVKLLEADETGEVKEVEFTFVLHFSPFTEAEFRVAHDETVGQDAPVADGAKAADRPIALLLEMNSKLFARLVEGWAKVNDEAGNPVPFSAEALRALIVGQDGLAVSAGIQRALSELRFGLAPAKNSPTSVVPGQSPVAAEAVMNSPATLAPSV